MDPITSLILSIVSIIITVFSAIIIMIKYTYKVKAEFLKGIEDAIVRHNETNLSDFKKIELRVDKLEIKVEKLDDWKAEMNAQLKVIDERQSTMAKQLEEQKQLIVKVDSEVGSLNTKLEVIDKTIKATFELMQSSLGIKHNEN